MRRGDDDTPSDTHSPDSPLRSSSKSAIVLADADDVAPKHKRGLGEKCKFLASRAASGALFIGAKSGIPVVNGICEVLQEGCDMVHHLASLSEEMANVGTFLTRKQAAFMSLKRRLDKTTVSGDMIGKALQEVVQYALTELGKLLSLCEDANVKDETTLDKLWGAPKAAYFESKFESCKGAFEEAEKELEVSTPHLIFAIWPYITSPAHLTHLRASSCLPSTPTRQCTTPT